MQAARYGFRIVGSCRETRRLVDSTAAISGYAACDEKAEVTYESYLSAFQFGHEFRRQMEMTHSTKGYNGPCWSWWLWWDIDRETDIESATRDARRLCVELAHRYELDGDELLIFYSGCKGYHVGLPTSLWTPQPSTTFNKVSRRFAEYVADLLKIEIDVAIYDKVRAFRAPNSRHPKTGRHKRRLAFDELLRVSSKGIVERAAEPLPFELPEPPPPCDLATTDWQAATERVRVAASVNRQRRTGMNSSLMLNRRTMEFIRDGAQVGERHRVLFSSAANLAEFGCPAALAHALLGEAGRDSGLAPKDVRRQIECGLSSCTPQNAAGMPQVGSCDSIDQQAEKRDTGDSERLERQFCQQLTRATR